MLKKYFYYLCLGFLTIALCVNYFMFYRLTAGTSTSLGDYVLKVYCKDATTAAPIDGAKVCITDLSYYATADKNGLAIFYLPKSFSQKTNKPFTEITLLVYASGYQTQLNYGFKIYANINAQISKVNLMQITSPEQENELDIIYTLPPDDYSAELINFYKK